uniref:U-box domain-containing protein n=1 Tax=Heliothis virescens TaxID=7102 RepID=A0A2A4K0I5_HELVI
MGQNPKKLAEAEAGGVQSCDFASPTALELPDDAYLLATAGCDSLIKLWLIHYNKTAAVRAVVSLAAHGGGAASLLAWRAPPDRPADLEPADEEAAPPCFWTREGVTRWLRECVTRVPGSEMKLHEEEALIQRAEEANLMGSQLLSTSIETLLETFGYVGYMWKRNLHDLEWLRAPDAAPQQEQSAPHALRCPLSHRLMREPAFAADGFTYERANILEWFIAADGAVSPISGRRLHNTRVQLNYGVRDQLRAFLRS